MITPKRPRVVFLVDNKRRDLMVAGLIAHQLERIGIDCALEPLESTFAVLAAYEPDMIIFNHLSASQLMRYSRRLKELGVLVGVLPNEGIGYKKEGLDFLALKAHSGAHVDLFFCWNEPLAEAVRRNATGENEVAQVVGIPRFDFYFSPWSRLFQGAPRRSARPQVLVCTNYVFAKYLELPPSDAEALFSSWAKNIPDFEDYWGAIRTHHANRGRLFDFLRPLLESDLYDVVLRPHPGEPSKWYADRIAELPGALQERITMEPDRNITELILGCDLEISMDTCTTALESWIARKPTIDLDLQHHPMLTNAIVRPLNVHCTEPAALPALVAEALAHPDQPELAEARSAHLERWCHSPDGTAAEGMAKIIAEAISAREPRRPLSPRLTFDDRRKGLKLKLLRAFNLPYNWNPLLPIRGWLNPGGTFIKRTVYAKTIKPSDVRETRQRFQELSGAAKMAE